MNEKPLEEVKPQVYVAWNRYEECVVGVFSSAKKYMEWAETQDPKEREWITCSPFLIDLVKPQESFLAPLKK